MLIYSISKNINLLPMKKALQSLAVFFVLYLVSMFSAKLNACSFNANFKYYVTAGCSSSSVYFQDVTDTVGANIRSFSWSFGDGSADDTSNFNTTHVYGAGSYSATLTLKDNKGCSDSYSSTITVSKFEIKV